MIIMNKTYWYIDNDDDKIVECLTVCFVKSVGIVIKVADEFIIVNNYRLFDTEGLAQLWLASQLQTRIQNLHSSIRTYGDIIKELENKLNRIVK